MIQMKEEVTEMTSAVRYYSRSGHTKLLAEAIAKGAGVSAVSVDEAGSDLKEPVDILYVGGALYAYGLDTHLKDWLSALDGKQVRHAVVFSTTWLSRHSLVLIRKALQDKGIQVLSETIYCKGKPDEAQLQEAEETARRISA